MRDTVPYLRQVSFAEVQTVADVIQAQCVAQPGKNHGGNMIRCRKCLRLNAAVGLRLLFEVRQRTVGQLEGERIVLDHRGPVEIQDEMGWLVSVREPFVDRAGKF